MQELSAGWADFSYWSYRLGGLIFYWNYRLGGLISLTRILGWMGWFLLLEFSADTQEINLLILFSLNLISFSSLKSKTLIKFLNPRKPV